MPAFEPVAAPLASDERPPAGWVHLAALAAATLVGVYLTYLVAKPFLPALSWAVAFAVIAFPVHRWLARHVTNQSWAAGITVAVVVAAIVVPGLFVIWQMGVEATAAGQKVKGEVESGHWRETAAKLPGADQWLPWVEANVHPEEVARAGAGQVAGQASALLGGSAWTAIQALVMAFTLFFCLRDRDKLVGGVRSLLPLARPEADRVLNRIADSVFATVFATLVTGLLQGVTGGLLFWFLGLPSPVLWGAVMFVLGILPVLGAFLVWVPAAVYLAAGDRWGAAIGLTAWGVLMAGPVCNVVYARIAGDRMELHPVPALIAFVGGLAVFGVSGMVLGPVVVVVTVALVEIWKGRADRAGDSAAGGRAVGLH